jgi:uncharacterized damage-inducible protein DinB
MLTHMTNMTSENAKGMRDFLLGQLREEFATTRKVLAAVPAESSPYKPSEKCMSGLQLASHIALAEAFFLRGVINGKFEWKQQEFADPAAVLAYYDANVPALFDQLAALTGEQLAQPVTFAAWTQPAVNYLVLDLKHGIHHRGQLSAYLRPMGAKVPSIYGPSGDTEKPATA